MGELLVVSDGSTATLLTQLDGSVQLSLTTEAPQLSLAAVGPAGPPGGSTLGGYGVVLDNPAAGDVLRFDGTSHWTNQPASALVDGGNF